MTWYDDGGDRVRLIGTDKTQHGRRARCQICGRYPTLTKQGALRNHDYPWPHSQEGTPCPGSGAQVLPQPGQLTLDTSDQGDSSQ